MRLLIGLALLAAPVFFLCGFRQPTNLELTHLTPSGYKAPSAMSADRSWEQKADGALAVAQAEEAAHVENHPTGLLPGFQPPKMEDAVVADPPKSVAARSASRRVTPKSRGAVKKVRALKVPRPKAKRRQLMSRR